MEVNIGMRTKIRLGGRFITNKIRQFQSDTRETCTASTAYGSVKGLKRLNVYKEHGYYFSFEGIPFAKPPINELRFRAPQPPEPWQGVLDCTKGKAKPIQYNFLAKWIEGSEDCLYLNVYCKKLESDKPLPVMVWIYGGGYQVGEASRDLYSPDYFMQKDVIVVTFNYRLGVLGFLCLDDPELNIPGNAGLKDQVMALKWVKENIHNFNGDPENITVFGESAGAGSTQFMMMTPQTKGLFHKAIMQSGSVLCPWSFTEHHDWGYKFACYIGYEGENNDRQVYEFLQQQNAKKLAFKDLDMMTKEEIWNNLIVLIRPVIEPYQTEQCVVDKPLKEFLATGWGNEIPLLIGGNSFEGLLHFATVQKYPFLYPTTLCVGDELSDFQNLIPDDVKSSASFSAETKEKALLLRDVYFGGTQPTFAGNFFQFLNLLGHRSFWHGILRTLKGRMKYASNSPTYCYYFDVDSESFNQFRWATCGPSIRGTSHADDLSYLFYSAITEKISTDSREYKTIERMIGMWYNFALASNPNCKEIQGVKWEPISGADEVIKCLAISDDVEFKDLPLYKKLIVWDLFYKEDELI